MKTLNPNFLILLIGLVVAVTIMGCSKASTDNKLQGRWSRVFVEDLDNPSLIEEWEFVGNAEFRIHSMPAGPADTNYIKGTYTLTSYKEVVISGSSADGFPTDYNGAWRIIKLKKGALIIVRDVGGLTFREFIQL